MDRPAQRWWVIGCQSPQHLYTRSCTVPLAPIQPVRSRGVRRAVYKKCACTFQLDRFIPQELQGLNSLRAVRIAEPLAESQQQGAAVLLDSVVRLLYTFRQTIYIIVLTLKHLQSINICMYCLTDIINYSHLFSTFSWAFKTWKNVSQNTFIFLIIVLLFGDRD